MARGESGEGLRGLWREVEGLGESPDAAGRGVDVEGVVARQQASAPEQREGGGGLPVRRVAGDEEGAEAIERDEAGVEVEAVAEAERDGERDEQGRAAEGVAVVERVGVDLAVQFAAVVREREQAGAVPEEDAVIGGKDAGATVEEEGSMAGIGERRRRPVGMPERET